MSDKPVIAEFDEEINAGNPESSSSLNEEESGESEYESESEQDSKEDNAMDLEEQTKTKKSKKGAPGLNAKKLPKCNRYVIKCIGYLLSGFGTQMDMDILEWWLGLL